MFIWSAKYENLLREINELYREITRAKAEADGTTRLLMRVEEELRRQGKRAENERLRAEQA